MPQANIQQSGLLDSWGRRNRKHEDKSCAECGTSFKPRRASSTYCSRECKWANNGGQNKKAESWWVNAKGYIEGKMWLPDGTQVRIKKHRHIMEQHLGRKLLPNEDVHHIDGNKANNAIENLQVIDHGEHSALTNKERYERAAIAKATGQEG